MAGLAKTKSFLLSTATVMVGPQDKLHELNPTDHSLGLTKNVQVSYDPTSVELTQGIKNNVVMSVKNGEGIRVSCEVYEFTLRNLAYGAGFDASGTSYDPISTIWVTDSDIATQDTVTVGSDITSDLSSGDFVFLQNGIDDKVHIAKVDTVTFGTGKTTVKFKSAYKTATGALFPSGSRLGKVKKLEMGGANTQPELACKIVGLLPKDNAPFTILLPRMKITRGFAAAFQSDNFSNLPFEFTPYAGTPEDPFYSEYGEAVAILFAR